MFPFNNDVTGIAEQRTIDKGLPCLDGNPFCGRLLCVGDKKIGGGQGTKVDIKYLFTAPKDY